MLSENQEQQIPQQPQNSTFYVYNCYYPVVQDFMNQPPTLQIRNSSESLPQLMKNESIQMPHMTQGIPSFQFGGSTPFINPDDVLRIPQQNHFASYILNEQLKKQPSKNRIIEGTQILCDIEMVLISRYFDIKANVFCPPNNKYTLKDDTSITNAEWLKDRIQFRYKKPIKESFMDMIDVISREDEFTVCKPLKFQQHGFDGIERQVPKSVKSEKPFSMFILEIQKLIAQFLFNKY